MVTHDPYSDPLRRKKCGSGRDDIKRRSDSKLWPR
jgi:hypothetical protein